MSSLLRHQQTSSELENSYQTEPIVHERGTNSFNDKNGTGIPKIVITCERETEEDGADTDPMVTRVEPNQDAEIKVVAPDGGFGWFVVVGCFLSHVIIGGLERSDGVYFLEFQERFKKSAQLTAWPGALVSATRLCLGPAVGAICNRYSVRTSCLVGSLFLFVGTILNGQASNFYFLFFSHFFLQGIGRGLLYAPGLILVGMYFDKKLGMATGMSSSGVGVGTFLMVPLSQMLFDIYGYNGAFLITAAIVLNTCVSAMLYRPLSLHLKLTKGKEEKEADEISLQEGIILSNAVEALDAQSIKSWKAHHQSFSSRLNINIDPQSNEKDSVIHNEYKNASCKKKESWLKSSLKICFPIENKKCSGDKKNRKLFNFALLKNPSFLMFCLSITLFTAAFKSAFTFMPALVKSHNFSDSEAAMVLSISGIMDTIARIGFGLLFDLKSVKPRRALIFNSFLFLVAVASFILPTLTSYTSICLVSSLYGMMTGGYISQKSVISVDIIGVDNIANAFGILLGFQGLGMLLGPPIAGAIKDATGSFKMSFFVGGGMIVGAGFFMLTSNIFLKRQKCKMKKDLLNNR